MVIMTHADISFLALIPLPWSPWIYASYRAGKCVTRRSSLTWAYSSAIGPVGGTNLGRGCHARIQHLVWILTSIPGSRFQSSLLGFAPPILAAQILVAPFWVLLHYPGSYFPCPMLHCSFHQPHSGYEAGWWPAYSSTGLGLCPE